MKFVQSVKIHLEKQKIFSFLTETQLKHYKNVPFSYFDLDCDYRKQNYDISINLLKAPQEDSRVCWVPIGPIQIITREETSSKWLTDWTRNFHHHEKVSFNNPY